MYQLADESAVLARAASERGRRTVLIGPLAAMVLVQSEMSETEVRSMLEASHRQTYTDDKPDPAWTCVSTATSCEVEVPAKVLDTRLGMWPQRGLGMTKVTMSYPCAGRTHVQTAVTLEDNVVARLKYLDAAYSAFLKTGEVAPAPPGGNVAVKNFHRPAY